MMISTFIQIWNSHNLPLASKLFKVRLVVRNEIRSETEEVLGIKFCCMVNLVGSKKAHKINLWKTSNNFLTQIEIEFFVLPYMRC